MYAAVLKIMKQRGVIERHFPAIEKFEPGIYTIVRLFSARRIAVSGGAITISGRCADRQSAIIIPLVFACICLDARHKY
jgi:hypothetical protein